MSRVITALGLALLSVIALSSPASAGPRKFSCTPQMLAKECGKPFQVPSGKSVSVKYTSSGYPASLRAYNADGHHLLAVKDPALFAEFLLWHNDTNRTITVQIEALYLGGRRQGFVSGTYWVR
ncbi:hypothetical protein GCM10022247_30840 [Allokutzneria multivorans]|uniref:Secreted protein n=1 Tax=Allokutzneria multivorans TaxID=1142134 RepID=A0ABP7S596_9PSEU